MNSYIYFDRFLLILILLLKFTFEIVYIIFAMETVTLKFPHTFSIQ